MVALAKATIERRLSPEEEAIDLAHLARMTLGDTSLEREVLGLFDRQAELLLMRMGDAAAVAIAAFAHTLKGSARNVGAWRVAEAAAIVEGVATGADQARLARAVGDLGRAIEVARAAIACLPRR
jgi:HPt (histidine-containing phosphotransfer) domain-containing protein